MLHMYRDVKKTTYTQTKQKLTHPYKTLKTNTHTQTTKPHRPVLGRGPGIWTPNPFKSFCVVTFSLIAPKLSRKGPGHVRDFPLNRRKQEKNKNQVREGEKQ